MNEKHYSEAAEPAVKHEDLSKIGYAESLVSGPEHDLDISEEIYEDALFSSDEALEEHLSADPATALDSEPKPATPEETVATAPLFESDAALELALEEAEPGREQQKASSAELSRVATDSKTSSDSNDEAPDIAVQQAQAIDLSIFLPGEQRQLTAPSEGLAIIGDGFNSFPTAAKLAIGAKPANMMDIHTLAIPSPLEEERSEEPHVADNNKLSDKAKLFYSSQKAKFDEYFGRSLPERTLDLEFHFTHLKPRKDFDYIVRGIDIEKSFSTKGKSTDAQFKLADENLLNLSKCKMSHGNRLRLLNTYCNYLIPELDAVVQQQYRRPNASADAKRTAIAEHACNAIKHLITGFKQIYVDFYAAPNYIYGPQRDAANEIAYKIIDLIVYEQTVHAALQMSTQRTSIATMNNLYMALRDYETEELEKLRESISLKRHASINELFCRFQILLGIDLLTLSPTTHPALFDYLREQQKLIKLVQAEEIKNLAEPVLIVQYRQSEPPSYDTQLPPQSVFPVLIKVQGFFQQIKEHCSAYENVIGKLEKPDICQSLSALENIDAITLLSALNHSIEIIEQHIKPRLYEVYRPQKIQAHAGFAKCIKFLEYQYALTHKQTQENSEEDNALAAKIEPDKGQWASAMDEGRYSYLQAHTKLIIDVGDVLLLLRNQEGSQLSNAARVIRVERTEKGKTNLVVEILANQLTTVKVTRANNKLTPAILGIYENRKVLILSSDEPIHSGQLLKTKLADGNRVEFSVRGIVGGSKKTQLLTVD